jgi:hypothetical protein
MENFVASSKTQKHECDPSKCQVCATHEKRELFTCFKLRNVSLCSHLRACSWHRFGEWVQFSSPSAGQKMRHAWRSSPSRHRGPRLGQVSLVQNAPAVYSPTVSATTMPYAAMFTCHVSTLQVTSACANSSMSDATLSTPYPASNRAVSSSCILVISVPGTRPSSRLRLPNALILEIVIPRFCSHASSGVQRGGAQQLAVIVCHEHVS